MNLTIEDVFKYSYCITINSEKYETFCKAFQYFNLPMPNKFNGIINSDRGGAEGCYLSHRKLIEYAKENKFPYILIFEDDAYPCKNIINRLTEELANIPDNCGIFGLGYNQIRNNFEIIDRYITFFEAPAGTHAYIVFEKAYDELLASLDKEKISDIALKNENFSENCKPYWIHNFLFIQRTIKKYPELISQTNSNYIYPINLYRHATNGGLFLHNILPNNVDWVEFDDDVTKQLQIEKINFLKNSLLKYSYCITIDDDRYNSLCKVFKQYNLPEPIKFEGVKHTHGPMGCYLSHRKLIEFAKENKLPHIFIFEEDAHPCKNIIDELVEFMNCKCGLGFGIMCFGYNGFRGYTKQVIFNGQKYVSFSRPAGSHAYLVKENAYDELLASLDKEKISDAALSYKNFSPSCRPLWLEKYLFIQRNINGKQMSGYKSRYIYPHPYRRAILFSSRLPPNNRFENI